MHPQILSVGLLRRPRRTARGAPRSEDAVCTEAAGDGPFKRCKGFAGAHQHGIQASSRLREISLAAWCCCCCHCWCRGGFREACDAASGRPSTLPCLVAVLPCRRAQLDRDPSDDDWTCCTAGWLAGGSAVALGQARRQHTRNGEEQEAECRGRAAAARPRPWKR